MASTAGIVKLLHLTRSSGKVVVRATWGVGGPEVWPLNFTFYLYFDGDATTIDPTEMVKRNWLIGLLERALINRLPVTIDHTTDTDAIVTGVWVRAEE